MAFKLTMPPSDPGNAAFRGQVNALLAACKQPPFPIGQLAHVSGRITFLRVNEVGDLFGAPGDDISAEVIIQLDSSPDLFFGLQLRRDQNLLALTIRSRVAGSGHLIYSLFPVVPDRVV